MFKFAPNNFNYADCDRCFYLKYKLNIEIKENEKYKLKNIGFSHFLVILFSFEYEII